MTEDLLKPAAALTAARIKRDAPPAGPTPERAAVPTTKWESESIALPSSSPREGGVGNAETEGLLTWRRAGLFGIIYFGALVAFAAVFDIVSRLAH